MNSSTLPNLLLTTLLSIYTIGFLFFRVAELIPLLALYPTHSLAVLFGTAAIQFSSIGTVSKRILYLTTLAIVIYLIDYHIPKPLPPPSEEYTGQTVVITGGNSGVGYETARQLAVAYGMTVILACRSKVRCETAANLINTEIDDTSSSSSGSNIHSSRGKAIPMIVNLSNFESVQNLAQQLITTYPKIDTLFNNAGYVPQIGEEVNIYGLDPSFTSMHLSHFLLTELLLSHHPKIRVINTSSGTHHLCAIPFALLPPSILNQITLDQSPGCVNTNYLSNGLYSATDSAAYITAKMANIQHITQIPLHHIQATAVAIDLGWVGTHIQSFMEGILTPTNLGWMRCVKIGVLPVMHAILSSDDELLDEKTNLVKSGRTWKEGGVVMNVFGQTDEAFTFDWWWKESVGLGREQMLEMARGLWMVSMEVIGKHVEIGESGETASLET